MELGIGVIGVITLFVLFGRPSNYLVRGELGVIEGE